ncbi:MAG: carboxylating nicotinate-nucleotide diphosphorylase [Actinobacteria bacterium]|uniref:Probable nicotinate-nucleotide pyrophosphorylase [carboxylating] n=1 Tax=freshwater metagenome TaxID=449393 RepID=A0A6J7JF96_9ZZZZ|nr:carboxylating nicotinate-nucleotide diphosphorylase [Actinomycetota bacterium]
MTSALQPPASAVVEAVTRAIAEDLTPLGDLTSALLPSNLVATARFVSRGQGVVAGCACAAEAFRQIDPSVSLVWSVDDGDPLDAGTVLATATGTLASILTAERTALNFLGHLSGIASRTRVFVDAAAAGGAARIWDTRKTTPGLRSLEKAAVRAGGGANHRGNLSDWILLKDNHIALFGITEAVSRARTMWPARTVHVECDRLDQVHEALAAGADALLLDNMTPEQIAECVAVASQSARRPLLEASGGITLETVAAYSAAGVDCISIGGLTNSAAVIDIGLDIEPL